jgi:hypothetical protein
MLDWLSRLSEVRIGILFALLAAVYGFGLGGVFGAFEDGIKGHLQAEAQSVLDVNYGGDEAAMKKVTAKSWTYFKRAHLHANGLSASSLAMILLLAALPVNRRLKAVNAAVLGIGSLGYAMFWMFAGLRAPAMGSTGTAKESLQWLAIPAWGLCILGLVVAMVVAVRCLFLARPTAS